MINLIQKSRFLLVVLPLLCFCQDKATNPETETPVSNFEASYSSQDDNVLIATCYYPWYFGGTGGRSWGQSCMRFILDEPHIPFLGEYDCSVPAVISQHVNWSVDAGIDFWISSWWGPESETNNVILFDHLTNPDFQQKMGYCMLYETSGRFGGIPVNVDQNVRETFLNDLKYLAATHFKQSNYLKIDNKPVLYMYLTRTINGFYVDMFKVADNLMHQYGFDGLYLVGDEVYWNSPNDARAQHMDAISCYNPHTSVDWVTNTDDFVERTGTDMYGPWMDMANELGISFWVDVLPGFNDLGVRKEEEHPVIERKNGQVFEDMLTMAGEILDNQNEPLKVLVVTSFNEWFEDTQIEPVIETTSFINEPVEYTNGYDYIGYGTMYLDILKNFEQSLGK